MIFTRCNDESKLPSRCMLAGHMYWRSDNIWSVEKWIIVPPIIHLLVTPVSYTMNGKYNPTEEENLLSPSILCFSGALSGCHCVIFLQNYWTKVNLPIALHLSGKTWHCQFRFTNGAWDMFVARSPEGDQLRQFTTFESFTYFSKENKYGRQQRDL